MRRILPQLLLCVPQCFAPAMADDIDAYSHGRGYDAVYAHVVMDLGDTSLDAPLCTYGVDCGPPFTTDSAHRHLGDMYREGEQVTASGLFRAVLAAVIDDPQLDALRFSLLISNHHDNSANGENPGSGGGTILQGYERLAGHRVELLRTLKSIPLLASSAAHELQPKETYLEWMRYIAGGEVVLGRNTRGNFGALDPSPDYDGKIIVDSRYLTPFRDRQSCPGLYSILFTQGASARDADLDAAIAAQVPVPDPMSFEQLLAYLHAPTTDLLPQAEARVPLQRTWVVTSRERAGQAAEQAVAGGGRVWLINEPRQLQRDLSAALIGALAPGSQSMGAVFVEDTFRVGRVLDDVFIPLFSPLAGAPWPGNLKKLKLAPVAVDLPAGRAATFEQVVDARGLPAVEASGEHKGQLRFDALTFWTDVASLPPGDGMHVPLRADGPVVARGGAGQKIDGFVNYTGEGDRVVQYFIGDTNSDSPLDGYGPRQLFYEAASGVALQPLDADAATAAALRPLLDPGSHIADDALLDLIRWARGQDTATGSPAARDWLMGEVLHSRPLALNYGATPGYSQSKPNVRVLFGSGEGVFHVVENTDARGRHTGRELFGFYPREMLSAIAERRTASPRSRLYGVDGAPAVLKRDRNRDGTLSHTDGDAAWVYFGLRRGGSAYFALDVSDPDAVPALMWTIRPTAGGAFDRLGMTFATPVVGKVNYSGVEEDVVIFGGGYHGGWNEDYSARIGKDLGPADDDVGNAIYIVSARTGELVWKAEPGNTGASSNTHYEHSGLVDSIPSTVTALVTPEGVIHRLYVGDTGGAVWRVDLPPARGAKSDDNHRKQRWFITKLADLGADAAEFGGSAARDLRFFHAPDIVQSFDAVGDYDGVLLHSGDREHPGETHVENALFFIRDRQLVSGSERVKAENNDEHPVGRIQYADLPDRTACMTRDADAAEGGEATACDSGSAAQGWKYRYQQPGEMGVAPVLVDGGRVFASTFVPARATTCPVTPGRGRLHVLNLTDASAVANQQRSYDLGEGIPAAVEPIGESLFLPGGGADIYDLDGDGVRDTTLLLPSHAVKRYRTYWREPGVDPL